MSNPTGQPQAEMPIPLRILLWLVPAVVTVLISWLLLSLLPSPADLWCEVKSVFTSSDSSALVTVLLARLHGESEDDYRSALLEGLRREGQINVESLCARELTLSYGTDNTEEIAKAMKWLERRQADLLIWGYTIQNSAILYFVHDPRSLEQQRSEWPYESVHIAELDATISSEVSDAIRFYLQAIVLSKSVTLMINPDVETVFRDLVDNLEERTSKIRISDTGITSESASFFLAHGITLVTVGEKDNDTAKIREGAENLRTALDAYAAAELHAWALVTKMYLGYAFAMAGKYDKDPQSAAPLLAAAVQVYREAIVQFIQDDLPLNRAITLNNIGWVLLGMAGLEPTRETDFLLEARTAYEEAKLIWERSHHPITPQFVEQLDDSLRMIDVCLDDNTRCPYAQIVEGAR